jgi:hypothetical protein
LVLFCLWAAASAFAAPATPTALSPDKKLIEWGWDEPGPAYMRANAARMDRYGFDGVIFHADTPKGNFAWECWSAKRFEYADFAQSVADLQACKFKRMTDNFLRFNVCPGDVDWFDDAGFAVVVNNAKVAAKVAKEGGCKGFMFDVEMYGKPLFTYAAQAQKDSKSFAEYEAKVRQRGGELMRAINSEYPDITVLLTYAYTITGVGTDRSKAQYGLLKDLLDGMFEAAAPKTTIVDAYEGAYPFRKHAQFEAARQMIHKSMAKYTGVPDAYRKHIRAGFGVWMDMDWRRYGWHTDDFEMNYFTPQEFEYTLFCGLDVADKYVWVYTEKPLWWQDGQIPAAYREALRKAHRPHVIDDAGVVTRHIKGDTGETGPKAANQPGYSDEATFGDLKPKWSFIADLPKVWKFSVDPKNEGVKAGWFRPDFDIVGWRDMEIAKFWDEQGVQCIGYAWYRFAWDAPACELKPGQKLALWFGAVDETAEVWVNGVYCGKHDEGADYGWDKRFPIDVTGKLKPGERNLIAVRVGNTALAGGIWKNVKLAESKP